MNVCYAQLPAHQQSFFYFYLNRLRATIWQGHGAFCYILEAFYSKKGYGQFYPYTTVSFTYMHTDTHRHTLTVQRAAIALSGVNAL